MPTAVPAVDEVVPGTVAYELEQIRKVAKGGKQLSRKEFAEQIGITASQLMGAEKGRKIKDDVWEKIVAAYPQLERYASSGSTASPTSQDVQDIPLESDTIGASLDGPQTVSNDAINVINIASNDYTDDPYPLPGENLQQMVVLDVQPPTQTTEVEETIAAPSEPETTIAVSSDESVASIDAGSDSSPTGAVSGAGEDSRAVTGSSARYEQQHNDKRAENRESRLFSNSEIQTYKRCKRKWYLVWYRKLLLKRGEVVGARSTGTRIHYALEQYYVPDGEQREDPRHALDRIINEDRQVLVDQYGGVDSIPEDVKKEFTKSRELEVAMIEGYMEWLEETGADQGLKVIAPEQYVEVPFAVDNAPDKSIKLIGKIDVRVNRESDNANLFMDHKTRASLNPKTLHMDEQMLHYSLLEWLSSPDVNQKIDGALYNMLKKVKRTQRANPPFYAREQVSFNFVELKNYRVQVMGVIKDILRTSARLDSGIDHQQIIYPNKTEDCSWSCDFFPVCPMFDDGSRAEDMLAEHYREGDPLEYYEDKHLKE